jgi:transcriptional regulator with XRE-family HTH domain
MVRRNETKLLRAFASNFRHWRKYHDLTLQQLAVADPSLGHELLQRLERGQELPDYRTLMRLCQILELVPEQLLPSGVLPEDLEERAPASDPATDPLLLLHQAAVFATPIVLAASLDTEQVHATPNSEDLNPLVEQARRTDRHVLAMERAHLALEHLGARLSERGAEALDLILSEIVGLIEPVNPGTASETMPLSKKRTI